MRRPVWILHVFVVGLALHNFVMSELYAAGVRGTALEVVSAWKELLLALGLVLVLREHGSFRFNPNAVDWLALAYGALVVIYGVVPQHVLDGSATHKGVLYGVREDLLPVAAYFFGRGLDLTTRDVRRVGTTIVASAAGVAAFGLIDIWTIPLSWWRGSGAPGWFSHQLGFSYRGLSNLPENFVYNTGNERPLRRLVSFFLSPLASSYMFVTALILCAVWLLRLRPRLVVWLPVTGLIAAGLLWTHSRSSYIALALGLADLAVVRRQWRWSLGLVAAGVVAAGFVFVEAYPHIAPATRYTPRELAYQVKHAHQAGAGSAVSGNGVGDASTSSHLSSLRAGIRTVLDHPQGYGPGNAGSTAARTGVEVRAGESSYTQLGVDTGLAGGLLFVALSVLLYLRVARRTAWLGAAFLATLALGLQTDIIGVPWLVYVLWPLCGWCISHPEAAD
jgi:hypothetical protein